MNPSQRNALQYVKNTNGGATRDNFIEDHEPIGEMLWSPLYDNEFIEINNKGFVVLTEAGEKELA